MCANPTVISKLADRDGCRAQVTVPNLQTGSTYYYKVGDPTKPNGVSKVMSFHVPCTNDSSSYPFRLGCIADVGQTFNSTTTLTKLQARTNPKLDAEMDVELQGLQRSRRPPCH